MAGVAVRSITDPSLHDAEFGFGGPETYTQTEIARLANRVLGQTAARDMVGTPVGEHSLKDFNSSLAH
jgi:hypothetical protein